MPGLATARCAESEDRLAHADSALSRRDLGADLIHQLAPLGHGLGAGVLSEVAPAACLEEQTGAQVIQAEL